jgi:endonuclease-3
LQNDRKGDNAQVAMNTQNKKIAEIIRRLKKEYTGTPQTVLRFTTPLELLVATILSAQTTDVLVNKVTVDLFKSAKVIIEKFGGKVPQTMEELVSLPGVARKTANIVLSGAFGISEGIAVDTHVKRLAYRLGLTKHTDPVKIEQDLLAITPKEEWGHLSHLLIFHGRTVCQAKKADHAACVLVDICPSKNI